MIVFVIIIIVTIAMYYSRGANLKKQMNSAESDEEREAIAKAAKRITQQGLIVVGAGLLGAVLLILIIYAINKPH